MTREIEVLIFAHARILRKELENVTVQEVLDVTCDYVTYNGGSPVMKAVIENTYQARVIAAAGIGYDPRTPRRNKKA